MSFVGIEDHDDVAVVTLARPPANALDPALVTRHWRSGAAAS
jgi:enoyl-CoA hydratase/carnithine racemase